MHCRSAWWCCARTTGRRRPRKTKRGAELAGARLQAVRQVHAEKGRRDDAGGQRERANGDGQVDADDTVALCGQVHAPHLAHDLQVLAHLLPRRAFSVGQARATPARRPPPRARCGTRARTGHLGPAARASPVAQPLATPARIARHSPARCHRCVEQGRRQAHGMRRRWALEACGQRRAAPEPRSTGAAQQGRRQSHKARRRARERARAGRTRSAPSTDWICRS